MTPLEGGAKNELGKIGLKGEVVDHLQGASALTLSAIVHNEPPDVQSLA